MSRKKEFLLKGIRNINKADLIAWLQENLDRDINPRKAPKEEVLEIVSKLKILELNSLINTYPVATAADCFEVYSYLNITKTERLRWQEDKLKIAYWDNKSFKYGSVPMFNRNAIASITDKKIASWRSQHEKAIAKSRSTASKKAAETRTKNNALKIDFADKLERSQTR